MSSEDPIQTAIENYQQGNIDIALEQMQNILIAEPQNPTVRIEFANMLMREKRFNDARDLLNSLSSVDKQNSTVLALFSQLESIDAIIDAPDIEVLLTAVEQDPADFLAQQQLSAHYQLRGDYAAAMQHLLEIVRQDRHYNDDAGHTELLKIFDILGSSHELVGEYRKKLAQILN